MPITTKPVDAQQIDATVVKANQPPIPATITLYDFIAAIRDVVGPGDDDLVVATTVRMFSSRRVMFPVNATAPRRFMSVERSGHAALQDTLVTT
jgi:hypothetical protein